MSENPMHRGLLLRRAMVAAAFWILLFSFGMLVDSQPIVQRVVESGDIPANLLYLPFAILTVIPTNVAILSVVSGYIGGCLSNLRVSTLQKTIENLKSELAAKQAHEKTVTGKIADGIKGDWHQHLKVNWEEQNRLLAEISHLSHRVSFLEEEPLVSGVRGLIVYLVYLATVLLATSESFSFARAMSEVADPASVAAGIMSYVRFAGFVSILSFAFGYDPSTFEQILSRATKSFDGK